MLFVNRKSDALGTLLACTPIQQLLSLSINATGLTASDTAMLAGAKQLTALDLSCNPCMTEGCMQHLHGEPAPWISIIVMCLLHWVIICHLLIHKHVQLPCLHGSATQ